MRKRDELADPKSCLNKAADNAMIFVLLDTDTESAIAGVRGWIEKRIELGLNQRTDQKILTAEQWIETVLKEQGLEIVKRKAKEDLSR